MAKRHLLRRLARVGACVSLYTLYRCQRTAGIHELISPQTQGYVTGQLVFLRSESRTLWHSVAAMRSPPLVPSLYEYATSHISSRVRNLARSLPVTGSSVPAIPTVHRAPASRYTWYIIIMPGANPPTVGCRKNTSWFEKNQLRACVKRGARLAKVDVSRHLLCLG